MDGMKFMIAGREVEISHQEAKQIAEKFGIAGAAHHESNEHYQSRAFHNICEAAKYYGLRNVKETEDDMKDLMVFALRHEDPKMLGELVEWFIAEHTKKVGA